MATVDSTHVEYREIPNFPGYRIGDNGSVWNAWVNCRWGRRLTKRWKQLKPGIHRKGYLCVNLTPPEGKYKTLRVHRLVLTAFVGPCPEGMECRHLNGIKADCRLSNLVWGTPEQNREDNRDLGAYEHGESHSQARLTEDAVRAIRGRFAAGLATKAELAAEHGVHQSNIHAIVTRKSWKHID